MGPPIFIGGNLEFLLEKILLEISFNGAADFHRRKLWLGVSVVDTTTGASMGPPIFIGGNQNVDVRSRWTISQLQWGRRFSSAEITA